MQLVETRCISPISQLRMPFYSVKNPYARISAPLPDIEYIYISDRPIYRKTSVPIYSSTVFRSHFLLFWVSSLSPCVIFPSPLRFLCVVRKEAYIAYIIQYSTPDIGTNFNALLLVLLLFLALPSFLPTCFLLYFFTFLSPASHECFPTTCLFFSGLCRFRCSYPVRAWPKYPGFFAVIRPCTVRLFQIEDPTVRLGAVLGTWKSYGAVRCGFRTLKILGCGSVFSCILRCDSVRLTAPNRTEPIGKTAPYERPCT